MKIELDKECYDCYGSGNSLVPFVKCKFCKGLGRVLTEEGEELLGFLGRYTDIKPKSLGDQNET